jgi:hypothetical protein
MAGQFIPKLLRHHEMEVPKLPDLSQVLRWSGIWHELRNRIPSSAQPAVKKLLYRQHGSMTMSAEDRRFLVQYYRDDVRRLEHVMERDLSNWLR